MDEVCARGNRTPLSAFSHPNASFQPSTCNLLQKGETDPGHSHLTAKKFNFHYLLEIIYKFKEKRRTKIVNGNGT